MLFTELASQTTYLSCSSSCHQIRSSRANINIKFACQFLKMVTNWNLVMVNVEPWLSSLFFWNMFTRMMYQYCTGKIALTKVLIVAQHPKHTMGSMGTYSDPYLKLHQCKRVKLEKHHHPSLQVSGCFLASFRLMFWFGSSCFQQQTDVFSKQALVNQTYASCPGPASMLVTSKKVKHVATTDQDVVHRSWSRPIKSLKRELRLDTHISSNQKHHSKINAYAVPAGCVNRQLYSHNLSRLRVCQPVAEFFCLQGAKKSSINAVLLCQKCCR